MVYGCLNKTADRMHVDAYDRGYLLIKEREI